MFLFYSDNVDGQTISIAGDEHQHCAKVLRKKIGDQIKITDGQGQIFTAEITAIQKLTTICHIVDKISSKPIVPKLSIAISPTKNLSRIEWFVEKAVEIGISAIYFVHTQRTEKKSVNLERIHKICISAMKQSLQVHLPKIQNYKSVNELIENVGSDYEQKFIAYCDGPTDLLKDILKSKINTILLIGPEGDFTENEIKEATASSFIPVSLGDSRLRTETAGLVGLMMMKYS